MSIIALLVQNYTCSDIEPFATQERKQHWDKLLTRTTHEQQETIERYDIKFDSIIFTESECLVAASFLTTAEVADDIELVSIWGRSYYGRLGHETDVAEVISATELLEEIKSLNINHNPVGSFR